MSSLLVSFFSLLLAQDAPRAPRALKVGDVVEGEVAADSPIVHTPTLNESYADAPVRGVCLRVELPVGPATIELRSYLFDAYLVVRDRDGKVLAEDDDSLLRTHARLVLKEDKATKVDIFACALHGAVGVFEIRVKEGAPAPISPVEQAALAVEDARHEVETRSKVLGAEDPATAFSLVDLARLLDAQANYEEAQPLHKRALEICEKVHGPDHPETVICLGDLASCLASQGKYEEAREYFERTLKVCERVHGPDHRETAAHLSNLAGLLTAQGKYDEARTYYDHALKIEEKEGRPETRNTVTSLINLGRLLWLQGKYEEARTYYERARPLCEVVLGPHDELTAKWLNNFASLLNYQGKYEEARPLFERALTIKENVHGPDSPDVAICLNNLAWLLQAQGKSEEACSLYRLALEILEKRPGPENPQTLMARSNFGTLLLELGKYEEARPLLEKTLASFKKIKGPEHPHTAASLNNLAGLLDHEGKYEESRKHYQDALAIYEKALNPDHPDTAKVLNSLARLLHSLGKYEEARQAFARALVIHEKALGAEHPSTATSRSTFGLLLMDLGMREGARHLARENLDAVLAYVRREAARASEEGIRRGIVVLARAFEGVLSTTSDDAESVEDAFEHALLVRTEGFRLQSDRRRRLAASTDPALRAKLDRMQSVTAELSNLFSRTEASDREELEPKLLRLRTERDQLERETAAMLDARLDMRPLSASEVRSALPKGAALVLMVEHSVYEPAQRQGDVVVSRGKSSEPRITAWVTKPGDSTAAQVELGSSAALGNAVRNYLGLVGVEVRGAAAVGDRDPRKEFAAALREAVWEPLAPYLGDATTVLLAPDGPLTTLPFGLIEDASGRHLIEKHAFVLVDDLEGLARPAATPAASATPRAKSLLAIGGLDYDQRGPTPEGVVPSADRRDVAANWIPLSATLLEADGILAQHKRWFPGSSRLSLKDEFATEERLKTELPNYSVLHLATHGYFMVDGLKSFLETIREPSERARFETQESRLLVGYWPQFLCGLVCSGASQPLPGRDNGLLTGEEVNRLDLEQCDLVVLSACQTALGTRAAGDGMLSLSRSFREAGARTVIGSLWSQFDVSTKDLMLDFYDRHWTKGESKLDALRNAQLDMLRKNREKYGDTRPATWGAFVLTGDPD